MFENKLEQEIIQLYEPNLVDLFSINQISKKLNKAYPYINKKVSELISRGILKKIVIGRSHLCSLNLENEKTILLLSLNQIDKKLKLKKELTEEFDSFVKNNDYEITIHSIIHANGTDIFVVNSKKDKRRIERRFKKATIVDREEFIDLLFEKPKIFQNYIVIYGYERFFEMINSQLVELKQTYSPIKY